MTTTEPQLRPHDVRGLSLPDLDTFSVVERLVAILGDADESTRAEQQRREEAAQRQRLDDRIARAKRCAQQHGLILEEVRNYDTVDSPSMWRLTTDNNGNRFLPGLFDDAAWQQVQTILRGEQTIYVLPGGSGTLGRIEKWLEHQCPPFKP